VGRSEDVAEFARLSARVAATEATPEELARWRALRTQLAGKPVAAARAAPAPSPSGEERREHARMPRKLRVAWVALSELTVTFSDELSAGGLRLKSPRHVEPGAELVLRLEPAGGGEPLTTVARVAWSKREGGHYTLGIDLARLRPDERDRVEAMMHADAPPVVSLGPEQK
jgi:PilZ domain